MCGHACHAGRDAIRRIVPAKGRQRAALGHAPRPPLLRQDPLLLDSLGLPLRNLVYLRGWSWLHIPPSGNAARTARVCSLVRCRICTPSHPLKSPRNASLTSQRTPRRPRQTSSRKWRRSRFARLRGACTASSPPYPCPRHNSRPFLHSDQGVVGEVQVGSGLGPPRQMEQGWSDTTEPVRAFIPSRCRLAETITISILMLTVALAGSRQRLATRFLSDFSVHHRR